MKKNTSHINNSGGNLKRILKKTLLSVALVLLVLPGNAWGQTNLAELDRQINTVNQTLNKKKNEKDSLARDAAIIQAQIVQTELALAKSNLEITNLTIEINQTNAKIKDAQDKLKKEQIKMGEFLSVMYEEGNTSFLEQVFTANTFSDFMDRKEYLLSAQGKIKESADRIAALRTQLEKRKQELSDNKRKTKELRTAQEGQRAAQATQKALKDSLVAALANQEKGLQTQLNDLHARKMALSSSYGESVVRASSSAYPYGNPPPSRLINNRDPWGYLIGQCTSYVAWKRTTIGKPVPRGLGNANTWGTRAAGMGLSVSSTPRVGDVMVMPYVGGYGHVAYVEAVNGPSSVLISEYNWKPFSHTTRVVNPYNYSAQFIH
jgi:surface antigen